MRRPFRSRCFGTCHFCIKTSPHGYKLRAIVRKLQELKLRYSVISYLSYHSFNILDDLPKSDISCFLPITVPSAVRRPPSAVRIRRPHPRFTESLCDMSCFGSNFLSHAFRKLKKKRLKAKLSKTCWNFGKRKKRRGFSP